MADDIKGKIEEVRTEEAKIRKGFAAWARKFDPAYVMAYAIFVTVLAVGLAVYAQVLRG